MKYLKKHKRLLLISIVLVIASMFLVLNKSHAYHELPKVKLKGDINNSGLAIMIEKDYQTGEYQKLDSNTFPTDGYTLNRIKSGCVDKNGKDVDALTYNESDKTISIKTKQSVYCYLYYDNLFKGKGTEEEPYQINYIEDLVRLSNSTNKDLNTYANKNFKLMRDLDFNENASYMKYNDTGFGDINGVSDVEGIKEELTNKEGTGFMPIGFTQYFEGNFDGNNKRLDNLYVHNKTDIDKYYGFIAYLNNGSIKNITMSGEVLTNVNTPLGGIINRIANSTMDNCINEINVTSMGNTYAIGGLISWSSDNATITNSVNKGNVSNGGYTGGIIAGNQGGVLTIDNSHNEGIITNELGNTTGGLVGRDNAEANKTIIKNSYNAGEVTNSNSYEGGLVGYIYGTIEIYNSHNEGEISNTLGSYIGGLIGYGANTSNITINNSYNNNEVSINTLTEKYTSVGGLVGYLTNGATISNSYNLGNISNNNKYLNNTSSNLGGLGGTILTKQNGNNVIITNSYNAGTLKNSRIIGGLVAQITSGYGNVIIDRCYNSGDIVVDMEHPYARQFASLVGELHNASYILNSYNTGNMYLSNANSAVYYGGFVAGCKHNVVLLNSYNAGNISLKSPEGTPNLMGSGILSFYNNANVSTFNVTMNNVYNIGSIFNNHPPGIAYEYAKNLPFQITNTYYNNIQNIGSNSNMNSSMTAMSETDMKNTTFLNTLNQNVDELNNAGLETIDENLNGYTLDKWENKYTNYPNKNYPILTRKVEDLSGNENHGYTYNVRYEQDGVTTSVDENNLGYIYAGLKDHDFGNNFTIGIKFKFNSIKSGENPIFGNWEAAGLGIEIFNNSYNKKILDAALYTDNYYNFTKAYEFKENEWYTIIVTYDGTLANDNLKAYINGELYDKISVTGNIKIPSNTPFVIGGNPDRNSGINDYSLIKVKEALIFDRALTEEKDHISTNYKYEINVTNQEELLLWYKF